MRALLPIALTGSIALASAHAGDLPAEADAKLNAQYKALLAVLDEADQTRLRDAERAWIAFRDKECAFRSQGTAHGADSAAAALRCVADLSRERADALQRQLDCRKNDASCVPHRSAAAAPAANVACSASAGAKQAEEYAQQCIQVSPATHPPCNAANPCELIVDEIKRGCAMIEDSAPAFCAAYRSVEQ